MHTVNPVIYRALVVKSAIKLYMSTGIKVNTLYTPKNMARVAHEITGAGPFTARQLVQAQSALERFLSNSQKET